MEFLDALVWKQHAIQRLVEGSLSSKNVITATHVKPERKLCRGKRSRCCEEHGHQFTNFGNCTDVVAMWMNMNSNSVTDFEKASGTGSYRQTDGRFSEEERF